MPISQAVISKLAFSEIFSKFFVHDLSPFFFCKQRRLTDFQITCKGCKLSLDISLDVQNSLKKETKYCGVYLTKDCC